MADEDKKVEENKVAEEPKAEKPAEAPKAEEKAAEAKTEAPKEEAPKAEAKGEPKGPAAKDNARGKAGGGGKRRGPGGQGGHGSRGRGGPRGGRGEREVSEFTEKVVQVRRVTKVCKGGKKLSFRAVVVIGNEKGKVGVGVGKASEVINAIKKAVTDAKKNLVEITPKGSTISHTIRGTAGSANVLLKPAAEGTGVIAGGAARIVLELSGLGDVLAKSQGARSPLNVARATLNGLQRIKKFEDVAKIRGLNVKQMLFDS